MKNTNIVSLLLRLGLAFAFGYAGISSLLDPQSWIAFLPPFIGTFIDPRSILFVFSLFEIFLAIWLLSGRFLFYAATISLLMFVGIIIPNLNAMEIIFRDVTMVFAAASLMVLAKNENNSPGE